MAAEKYYKIIVYLRPDNSPADTAVRVYEVTKHTARNLFAYLQSWTDRGVCFDHKTGSVAIRGGEIVSIEGDKRLRGMV